MAEDQREVVDSAALRFGQAANVDTATLDGRAAPGGGRAHLLVIEDGSTSMVPLPAAGAVAIGRGSDVDVRVDHASVSRRHARIVVERGDLRVADLDSHNGTRVNGVRIDGARALITGDVIAIGEVLLVVHSDLARALPHVVLDEATWRRRLAEEVDRAVAFRRSLAVLAIGQAPARGEPAGEPGGAKGFAPARGEPAGEPGGAKGFAPARGEPAGEPGGAKGFAPIDVGAALRSIDVLGRDGDQQLLALLPEADAATARQLAQVVLEAARRSGDAPKVGIALCPSDATDGDNLVLAARAAAKAAGPSGIGVAADAAQVIAMGEREVLVCHPAMLRVFQLLKRLAASDLPVLIIGETGVGKENAAYAVHHDSRRAKQPFVAVNCAALPEQLVESQLFGHDKGAFTGAITARAGLFETASGGTLFLDEIGELAPAVQAKLLRALETKRITRVGETREREVDIRIVAATHRNLEAEVEAKRFREDLYFRIGAARVHLLPLRERRCEIPMLFRALVAQAARRAHRAVPEASPLVIQHLLAHGWPGNVRELKHVAELLVATVEDDRIEPSDLPPPLAAAPVVAPPAPTVAPLPAGASMRRLSDELEEIERLRMTEAMAKTGGVKTRAAALLGMPIRTFNMKFKQYGL